MLSHYIPEELRNEILTELREASMEVIRGKGGTVFGPALHIIHLIRMITEDARELVTCSCILDGEYGMHGCSLGVPVRIGREGIHDIEEWRLDAWEQARMDEAGRSVGELCRKAVS
jgi:malate dehydrogenase